MRKAITFFVVLFFIVMIVLSFFLIEYKVKYLDIAKRECELYSVETKLVMATIKVESGFKENSVSKVGAVGLMQIMPTTAKWVAEKIGVEYDDNLLLNPEYNIKIGTYYLQYLLEYYSSKQLAVCAYNAGMGKVNEWLKNKDYSKDGKSLTKIPYEETNNYLRKILFAEKVYSRLIV